MFVCEIAENDLSPYNYDQFNLFTAINDLLLHNDNQLDQSLFFTEKNRKFSPCELQSHQISEREIGISRAIKLFYFLSIFLALFGFVCFFFGSMRIRQC